MTFHYANIATSALPTRFAGDCAASFVTPLPTTVRIPESLMAVSDIQAKAPEGICDARVLPNQSIFRKCAHGPLCR